MFCADLVAGRGPRRGRARERGGGGVVATGDKGNGSGPPELLDPTRINPTRPMCEPTAPDSTRQERAWATRS
jgi:hypothetical protein